MNKITQLRKVNTRFGVGVVFHIQSFGDVFLPTRVANIINSDGTLYNSLIERITQGQLTMKYLGGQFHAIEFV